MNSGDHNAFAPSLRKRRIAAGLTQQELADRAGTSVRSVSDLERAINERPRRDTVRMLAAGLGLAGQERDDFLDAARRRPRARLPSYAAPPEPADALLGRAAELRAIEAALTGQEASVLTLTGPGGVGKTRLATEAARALADRFADGVVTKSISSTLPCRRSVVSRSRSQGSVLTTQGLCASGGDSKRTPLAEWCRPRSLPHTFWACLRSRDRRLPGNSGRVRNLGAHSGDP